MPYTGLRANHLGISRLIITFLRCSQFAICIRPRGRKVFDEVTRRNYGARMAASHRNNCNDGALRIQHSTGARLSDYVVLLIQSFTGLDALPREKFHRPRSAHSFSPHRARRLTPLWICVRVCIHETNNKDASLRQTRVILHFPTLSPAGQSLSDRATIHVCPVGGLIDALYAGVQIHTRMRTRASCSLKEKESRIIRRPPIFSATY